MSNKKNTLPEGQLQEEIYLQGKSFYIKLILGSLIFFLSILFYFLPVESMIKSKIDTALSSNKKCRITYQNLKFSAFLPAINLQGTTLGRGCIGNETLDFDQIKVKVIRPSFFPLGVKLDVMLMKSKKRVNLDTIIGIGSTVLRIDETNLDASLINSFIPSNFRIKGKFNINGLVTIKGNNKFSGSLLVKSNNFQLNPTTVNIMGLPLSLPLFNFGVLQIKTSVEDRKVRVENIKIGNAEAPVAAQLKGSGLINLIDFSYTRVNLEGTIRFSNGFRDQFSIINGFLSGKKEENGNYFFKINGTLKNPKYSF